MKKRKIAIFGTAWASEILYQYLTGLRDGLAKEAADLYLFTCFATYGNSEGYKNGELNIFKLPDMHEFDAALAFANGIDYQESLEYIRQNCQDAGIPLIFTGRDDPEFHFIGSDNYVGTKALGEHLVTEHGVKDIWFIAGSAENMDSNVRMQAIQDTLEAHGLTLKPEDICYTNWAPGIAVNYVWEHYEKTGKLPDAIICANDTLAMIICKEFRAKNIRVPEDVIVTGFDNEFLAQIYDPSISSVDQRFDLIGRKCAELLLDIFNERPHELKQNVPCEFIPSESCGCSSAKDFQAIRREIGRRKFIDQIGASNFDLKLSAIERLVMQGKTYNELGKNLAQAQAGIYSYEGNSFYAVLDPLIEQTIEDQQIPLRTDGYPEKMDAVLAMDNGITTCNTKFETKKLIPQVNPMGENRLFIFLPLHEDEFEMGYLVFCDDFEKVKEAPTLRKYVERFNIILGKYYRDLRVQVLHRRLVQMTETDALTHVKNRTAFESREGALQERMQSGERLRYAIAIFDVNGLKQINDSLGHEAGDKCIINSCRLICKTYKKSAVYRIGGDEFAVVLEHEDFEQRDELLESMRREMDRLQAECSDVCERVSIAAGIAVYDPEEDFHVSDVFKRADARMYENKAVMKAAMKKSGII